MAFCFIGKMDKKEKQIKILAQAIYELRILLGSYLGSQENTGESMAGHLAYALHNDALAIIENRPDDFNIELALDRINRIAQMFDEKLIDRFNEVLTDKTEQKN